MNPAIDKHQFNSGVRRDCGFARVLGFAAAAILSTTLLSAGAVSAFEMQKFAPWTDAHTPTLVLKDLQGQPRNLRDFKGRVVIVNFWATWCGPCVAEMPSLQKLRERINAGAAEPRIEVLAVNMAESPAKVKAFVQRLGVTFPVLLDGDEDAKDAWKVRFVPATFIVGADGRIRYSYFGDADWASDEIVARISAIAADHN